MIVTRNWTTAFLSNNNDFLLMKRSEDKKFAPGLWAGIGGHIEPYEINNPRTSCLREIFEETGIQESDITDFRLKYILLRRSKDEIRINHIYFGGSNKREIFDTNEGKLYWVPKIELLNKEYTFTIKAMLSHYIEAGYRIDDVIVGSFNSENNNPKVHWDLLQDWENYK